MPSRCWLCLHCDVPEIVEMMRFVEEKSAIMHIDVMATEISAQLCASYPDEAELLTEDYIKQHVARHVVTPVASITRITRDMLDICETLRPSLQNGSVRRPRKRRKQQQQQQQQADAAEAAEAEDDDDAEAAERTNEDEVGIYLRTVNQVMQIYRLHSRLLQAPG